MMLRPGIATIQLRDRLEFAPGHGLLASMKHVTGWRISLRDDGTDQLEVRCPPDARYLSKVRMCRFVRLAEPNRVTEWMVNEIVEGVTVRGRETVILRCDPAWRFLADIGIVQHQDTAGGFKTMNLGGFNGTVSNFLDAYPFAELVRKGIDYITRGTVDFQTERFTYSFDASTVLAQIKLATDQAGGFWRWRRDEVAHEYKIDVVRSLAGSFEDLWLKEGRNLTGLRRTIQREAFRSAVVPIGDLPPEEPERATLWQNSHPVIAVSGDVVTLGRFLFEDDPTQGPLGEDGQFADVMSDAISPELLYPAAYLRAKNGTLHKIIGSTMPGDFTLESGHGASFAVEDHAQIVADSAGTPLTELPSPVGIRLAYVQGTLPVAGTLGIRNQVRNALFRAHESGAPPETAAGLVDGNQPADNTILVKQMQTADGNDDFDIVAGDILLHADGGVGNFFWDRITTPVSVVAGAATITVTNTHNYTGDRGIMVLRMGGRTAKFFTRLPAEVNHAAPFRVPRATRTDLSALINGAATSWSAGGSPWVDIDGLTAGDVIEPGSLLIVGGVGSWILNRAVANGSGQARVVAYLHGAYSDNAAATIKLPPTMGDGSGYAIGQLVGVATGTQAQLTQDIRHEFIPGAINLLWASVTFVTMNASSTGWTTGPRISFLNSSSVEQAGATAPAWTPSPSTPGTVLRQTLRVQFQVNADFDGKIRLQWASATGDHFNDPWIWIEDLNWNVATVGPGLPIVDGYQDKLWYEGQLALQLAVQGTASWSGSYVELERAFGAVQASRLVSPGSIVRVRSKQIPEADNIILRCLTVDYDGQTQERHVTLGARLDLFHDLIARFRAPTIYVNLPAAAAEPQTILAATAPSPGQLGANRFVVPQGTSESGTPPIAPYIPPTEA